MFSQHEIETIAKEAMQYARACVPVCIIEPKNQELSTPEEEKRCKPFLELRAKIAQLTATTTDQFEPNVSWADADDHAEFARSSAMGNCEELAILAIEYIGNKNNDNLPNNQLYSDEPPDDLIYAEVVRIKNADHAVVVINRNKTSSIKEPEDWGENCYICDPWTREYYPAKYYQARLKGRETIKGPLITSIKVVTPATYILESSEVNTDMWVQKESKIHFAEMCLQYTISLKRLKTANSLRREEIKLYDKSKTTAELKEMTQALDRVDQMIDSLQNKKIDPCWNYRQLKQFLRKNLEPINTLSAWIEKEISSLSLAVATKVPPQADTQPQRSYKQKFYGLFSCPCGQTTDKERCWKKSTSLSTRLN